MNINFKCTLLALLTSVCAGFTGISLSPNEQATEAIGVIRSWIEQDIHVHEADSFELLDHETSVCVVLRHHGKLLGVGTASSNTNNPLAIAAKTAFTEVRRNKALAQLPREMLSHALASISIELELGMKPIPSPRKHFDRFVQGVQRGSEGIAVRRGTHWKTRLPAEMRLAPARKLETVLSTLCINVGVHPATALSHTLPQQEDITLYTVPTITIFQENSSDSPHLLIRGNELVDAQWTTDSLLGFSELLVFHLYACTNESGEVVGGYQPETDSLSPPLASAYVQLMTAEALFEYATIASSSKRKLANRTGLLILSNVEEKFRDSDPIPNDVAASFVVLMSKYDLQYPPQLTTFKTTCASQILALASEVVKNTTQIEQPHVYALIANAVSALAINAKTPYTRELAIDICSACIDHVSLESKVSTIPWIVDAVMLLSPTGIEIHKDSIEQLLDLVLSSQNMSSDEIDHHGGFSLSSNDRRLIDARSVRMIPMLATLSVTKNTIRPKVFRSLGLALRYVSQITTSPLRATRFQNPSIAKGGVRSSTWDSAMPTEATAMALIGVSKAINSFTVAESAE